MGDRWKRKTKQTRRRNKKKQRRWEIDDERESQNKEECQQLPRSSSIPRQLIIGHNIWIAGWAYVSRE